MTNGTSEDGIGAPDNASGPSGNLMYLIVSHNEVSGPRMAMNRFVRLEDLLVRQGVLAIALLVSLVLPSAVFGQQVPDAPTPQAPGGLGNITSGVTPGKGTQPPQEQKTTPTPPAPPTSSQPAAQDQDQQTPPDTNITIIRHPGQLRRRPGNGPGQETSTGGRADLARF